MAQQKTQYFPPTIRLGQGDAKKGTEYVQFVFNSKEFSDAVKHDLGLTDESLKPATRISYREDEKAYILRLTKTEYASFRGKKLPITVGKKPVFLDLSNTPSFEELKQRLDATKAILDEVSLAVTKFKSIKNNEKISNTEKIFFQEINNLLMADDYNNKNFKCHPEVILEILQEKIEEKNQKVIEIKSKVGKKNKSLFDSIALIGSLNEAEVNSLDKLVSTLHSLISQDVEEKAKNLLTNSTLTASTASTPQPQSINPPNAASPVATPPVEAPEDFFCPITLEIMCEPVMLDSGHTYEREAIEDHLASHNTDPNTREELSSKTWRVNHTLKKAIIAFMEKNPQFKDQMYTPKTPMVASTVATPPATAPASTTTTSSSTATPTVTTPSSAGNNPMGFFQTAQAAEASQKQISDVCQELEKVIHCVFAFKKHDLLKLNFKHMDVADLYVSMLNILGAIDHTVEPISEKYVRGLGIPQTTIDYVSIHLGEGTLEKKSEILEGCISTFEQVLNSLPDDWQGNRKGYRQTKAELLENFNTIKEKVRSAFYNNAAMPAPTGM